MIVVLPFFHMFIHSINPKIWLCITLMLAAVLVNALWREGKIDEAVAAVQDMEKRGIVGTASLYYDIARCLCSSGRCQEALLQVFIFDQFL